MKKRALMVLLLVSLLASASCTSRGEERSDDVSVHISTVSTEQSPDISEESSITEQGRTSPEEVIETVVEAQFSADNHLLVSLFSEFIKIGRRGEHPEYDDTDIANLMGMTGEIINEYRYLHFLNELVIDSVDYIELDSSFALAVKNEYETAGLNFAAVTQICEVKYTVKYIKSGVNGTRSESNYCAEINGKWFLLYWEGNLYGE